MPDRQIVTFKGNTPKIADRVFIADGARIIGDVRISSQCSIWFNAVIRGDIAYVDIGQGSSIQDNSTVHVAANHPCIIGEGVTVGHNAVLHGCKIADNCLVGMGAVLLNGCEIGKYSIIAAGTVIPENKKFPPRSMIIGSPARFVRKVTQEEVEGLILPASQIYRKRAEDYLLDYQENK